MAAPAFNQYPFAVAKHVLAVLQSHGHEAYLVGGCVRDLLLERNPKDWDITTSALPAHVEALFPKTVAKGKQFGVISVIDHGVEIEVATFRSDGQYTDGRRPDEVTYSIHVEDDVKRRDFTINGLLIQSTLDPDTIYTLPFGVVDLVGGRVDLERKLVRCIGDPVQRFTEDKLRMLRAIRFVAQLGFSLDPETEAAIQKMAITIVQVSRERVRDELMKLVQGAHAARAIQLLITTGLADYVLPQVTGHSERWSDGKLGRTLRRFSVFAMPDALLGLAMLLRDHDVSVTEEQLTQLKLSNEQLALLRQATWQPRLIEQGAAVSDAEVIWQLRVPGTAMALDLFWQDAVLGYNELTVEEAQAILDRWRGFTPEQIHQAPFITGDDLIAAGKCPGREFKPILEHFETLQLNGKLQSREEALEALAAYLHE